MKVTEDGRPVTSLSVQSAAAANGIGTVLLIDSSNSMKGSIDSAMAAARAFTARNPGQPLSVVFFNAKPNVALPLTTDRDQVQAVLAKPRSSPRARTSTTPSRRRSRRSGVGARRRPRRLALRRRRRRQRHEPRLCAPAARGAEHPRLHGRHRVRGLQRGGRQKIADDTGGEYAAATSPDDLTEVYEELGFRLGNEYLLRYKSGAAPDENVDVSITVDGYPSRSRSLHDPARERRRRTTAFRTADAVVGPIPLLVLLVIGLVFLAFRFFWNLRTNKALVARLGEFVTLPAEERAAERRKEVDLLLAAAAGQAAEASCWVEGFEEDVVGQINHDPRPIADLRGARRARPRRDRRCLVGRSGSSSPRSAWWLSTCSCATRRVASGTSSPSSFPRTSMSSPRRSAQATASRAPMSVVADEARSPRPASSRGSSWTSSSGFPRRGAGGDREADAERGHGPGRRPRARPA